jgi:hypothetical protein
MTHDTTLKRTVVAQANSRVLSNKLRCLLNDLLILALMTDEVTRMRLGQLQEGIRIDQNSTYQNKTIHTPIVLQPILLIA